jgi:cytoskeletal protein CcmA (bactofilin family)
VKADSARIAGRIKGSISARELVILKSARIDGDVSYEALTIEQGAQVEGRFSPRGHLAPVEPQVPDAEPLLSLASSKPPA